MNAAPASVHLHIGIFGRHGAGKSALLRALSGQPAGATADPVETPMELSPLGPVRFVDTTGVDDVGALATPRVEQTMRVLARTQLAVLLLGEEGLGGLELGLLDAFEQRQIPVVPVLTHADLAKPAEATLDRLLHRGLRPVLTGAPSGLGITELREALVSLAPDEFLNAPPILSDLVPPGDGAVLVLPADPTAPKGRPIVPRAQVVRDLLDHGAFALVVEQPGLRAALASLGRKPALVVCDSQAFSEVARALPPDVPLTSFSMLFARQRGDLLAFVQGALAIDRLRPGDPIALAEACSHHPVGEDVGRMQIPRWLGQYVGGPLTIEQVQGRDLPDDPRRFKLVIHCGSCMLSRREMLSRILVCARAGVPITNYGMALAYSLGIFERALQPFPAAREAFRAAKGA
jgi:[FeFe] hydrogenase H-cluster maturation GTPase HydF